LTTNSLVGSRAPNIASAEYREPNIASAEYREPNITSAEYP